MVKVLECPKCPKSFNHKGKFKKHLMSHEQLKPFKCPECGVMLSAEWILKRHRETKHSGVKPYVCFQCNVSFTSKDHLHRHLNTRKHVPFVCEDCKKVFQRITAFQNHKCGKGKKGLGFSESFDNTLISTQPSSTNTQNRSPERLSDKLEETMTDEKSSDESDSFASTPLETFPVPDTKMQIDAEPSTDFLSSPTLKKSPSTELLKEKCLCPYTNCKKQYSTRSNLRTHIRTSHERIGFTCEICKTVLMHNHTLQKHLQTCKEKFII